MSKFEVFDRITILDRPDNKGNKDTIYPVFNADVDSASKIHTATFGSFTSEKMAAHVVIPFLVK